MDLELSLFGAYDLRLGLLSIGVAVMSLYAALAVTGRIGAVDARIARGWLAAGVLCVGSGVWSTHFLGMLAFHATPVVEYASGLGLLSWICAALGTLVTLYLVSSRRLTLARYIGASVSMIAATVGMHDLAIQAVRFAADAPNAAAVSIGNGWLAMLVANPTVLLLGGLLAAIAIDRRLDRRIADLRQSLETANLQLHHASRRDPLTNLGNRQRLNEQLELAIQTAEVEDSELALIYLDLDNFKNLNENLGHDYGDEILQDVGHALSQSVRSEDFAARVGGDEFVLLITSDASESSLRKITERLVKAVHNVATNQYVRLSASIGVARYPGDGTTTSVLMKSVDLAMYSAKDAGKDRCAFFRPELTDGLKQDFAIQNELADALAAGQIHPFYQPKYDVAERRIVGAEALARWRHPEEGMIPPDRFIKVAERTNQIDNLQVRILNQICADVRSWKDQGLTPPPVAFNLSAMCLRNHELPQLIVATLEQFDLSPQDLICEITETAAIPELEHTLRTLLGLRRHGIRIALDDFGTGLSSMSYLRDLPIDQLKIDRAFISQLGTESDEQSRIVYAIINLAHSLNLSVVAEGVELEAQFEHLRRLACDEVQGYLFSKPVPPEAFADMLERPNVSRNVVSML